MLLDKLCVSAFSQFFIWQLMVYFLFFLKKIFALLSLCLVTIDGNLEKILSFWFIYWFWKGMSNNS